MKKGLLLVLCLAGLALAPACIPRKDKKPGKAKVTKKVKKPKKMKRVKKVKKPKMKKTQKMVYCGKCKTRHAPGMH